MDIGHTGLLCKSSCHLTPHPGEMARLLQKEHSKDNEATTELLRKTIERQNLPLIFLKRNGDISCA
jgi:NAD(P)H-hydrate repair Nnr-like enzyme with NAD(P)H-hydrate dehydratase domain